MGGSVSENLGRGNRLPCPHTLMLKGQFQLPIVFDLAATFLFGVTGALAALRRGYDFVGLFALVFVTAVGGALIRDGIFIQQGPGKGEVKLHSRHSNSG